MTLCPLAVIIILVFRVEHNEDNRLKEYSSYLLNLLCHGSIAQLGEHLPYKQGVTGSSPVVPIHGEIAQLARARGSYPRCRGFESPSRYYRCCRLQHLFFLSISEADLECPLRYLLMNAVASRSVSGSFQVKRHKTWHVFFPVNNF